MKQVLAFGLSVCVLAGTAQAQSEHVVGYLAETPVLDGALDEVAQALVSYEFAHHFTFDNPPVTPVTVSYRIGYTPAHLYLHIQTDADAVSYHNRGYLWGDGYKLLLGVPEGEAGTDQFYDIGISPTQSDSMKQNENLILSYNFEQVTRRLGPDSASFAAPNADGTGFELLIAWSDLAPYHPWMMDEIGFNLYFAKGFDTPDDGYFPHGYAVVQDEGIWDEEIPLRQVTSLSFETPAVGVSHLVSQPAHGHLAMGEPLPVRFSGATATDRPVQLSLRDTDGQAVSSLNTVLAPSERVSSREELLILPVLDPGLYTLDVTGADGLSQFQIGVLPDIDFAALRARLEGQLDSSLEGAALTLLHKLEQIETLLLSLERYETGEEILELWSVFESEYVSLEAGVDPYLGLAGPYRRAFLSAQDGTLQPYTIRLPQNYDPSHAYPLLVFLHGSGSDERGLLDRERGNGQFIELAPYGRDMFRAYSEPESQADIVEAIEDVIKRFSVDEEVIVMGGFSMGGYGAFRSYYENPDLYAGLAVFAGHPNLANAWLEGDYPNFLDLETLEAFSGTPVFVYHGLDDAALLPEAMQLAVDRLRIVGADVTTRFVEGRGHVYQDEETHEVFGAWLNDRVTEPSE